LYTSCVLWVAPLCAFSINFTYQKKRKDSYLFFLISRKDSNLVTFILSLFAYARKIEKIFDKMPEPFKVLVFCAAQVELKTIRAMEVC
jgi:hypothetical protein